MPDVVRVVYSSSPDETPVVVERLTAQDQTFEVAEGLLNLTLLSYAEQFGSRAAEVSNAFLVTDDVKDRVLQGKVRMLAINESLGWRSWVIRGENPNSFDGFIQVSPIGQGVYLKDLLVRPPFKRGLGSMLLHAALTDSFWPQEGVLRLSGFTGSSANNMYLGLGLVESGTRPGKKMIDFQTPAGCGLRGVIAALEQRRPFLSEAERTLRV